MGATLIIICTENSGEGWTAESMRGRCDVERESALKYFDGSYPSRITDDAGEEDYRCPIPIDVALGGYCVKEAEVVDDDAAEATVMMIEYSSDCATAAMACETFVGGTFNCAEACSERRVGRTEQIEICEIDRSDGTRERKTLPAEKQREN